MKFVSLFKLLALFGLVLLPACGSRYTKKALNPLTAHNTDFEETKNKITVRAKALDTDHVVELFNGKGESLFSSKKQPIHVIQLSCLNNTDKNWLVGRNFTDLRTLSTNTLFSKLSSSPVLPAVGIAAGGVAALGAVELACVYSFMKGLVLIKEFPLLWFASTGLMAFVPLALAVGIPYACYSIINNTKINNKTLYKDLLQKTLQDNNSISVHEQRDWLIFVDHCDFKPNFSLAVTNVQDNEIVTFNVDLLQKASHVWNVNNKESIV